MSLATPHLLWLLPVVGLISGIEMVLRHRRRRRLNRFIPTDLQTEMGIKRVPGFDRLRWVLRSAGLLLVAFSLARPQWGHTWREAEREALDLMVMVDTSNSMRADDFKPTRLQRAKWGIEELVKELVGDRVGLIAFAGEGVLQCPLTLDYGTFLMNVQDLFPGIVPLGGTDLQAALETAVESFEDTPDADKVILLISDGESHAGDLTEVTDKLKQASIRVFAVGVGTTEGSLIPMDGQARSFLKNRNEEVVKSALDEKTLKRLAARTDGLYVRANPRDFGVSEIITEGLKPLKRSQVESERVKEMQERFQLFLAAGVFCLLLDALAPLPGAFSIRRKRP